MKVKMTPIAAMCFSLLFLVSCGIGNDDNGEDQIDNGNTKGRSTQKSIQDISFSTDQLFEFDFSTLSRDQEINLVKILNDKTNIVAFQFEDERDSTIDKAAKLQKRVYRPDPFRKSLNSDLIDSTNAKKITSNALTSSTHSHNLKGLHDLPLKYWTIDSKGLKKAMKHFITHKYEGIVFYPALHQYEFSNDTTIRIDNTTTISYSAGDTMKYHSLVFGPVDSCGTCPDGYEIVKSDEYYDYVNPCPTDCGKNPTDALNYIPTN